MCSPGMNLCGSHAERRCFNLSIKSFMWLCAQRAVRLALDHFASAVVPFLQRSKSEGRYREVPECGFPLLSAFACYRLSGRRCTQRMTYPVSCCSSFDCGAVPAAHVGDRPQGSIVETTGETIAYKDARLRQSLDGEHHWCSVNGSGSGRTVYLFEPAP